jgi:cyclohexyl-isocyanide hydratase
VTAGMDFGLTMAAKLRDDDYARTLQLMLEYDPQPPFDAGSEAKAGEKIDRRARAAYADLVTQNQQQVAIARERLRDHS